MSRESELYKDKIEVSLDGRQIFYLFFGGAVIVGLVFVLGVMVGRRVEARGHVERAHVEAAVDPLAALDRLEGGAGLSFPGALRGGDGPTSDVEKTIAGMQNGHKPEAKKAAAEAAKPDLAKPEDKKPEAKKLDKAEPALAKDPERKSDEKKAEEKKAEKRAEKKAEDKKGDDKKGDDKKSDDNKKSDDGVKKAEVEKKPDGEKKQKFTLQLSSFKDKVEAESFLDSIKAAGYSAYLTEGEVDGKQFFRVRMGSYRTLEAANDAKADFEKSAKKSALVTKL